MDLLTSIFVVLVGLAHLFLILLIALQAFWRWRVLDLATRAQPHASPQQQIKMAQLAAEVNLVELDGLSKLVLRHASERLARQG